MAIEAAKEWLNSALDDLITIEEIIEKLDELYIESKYPGKVGFLPYGKPSIYEARKFYSFAKYIFDEICKFLKIKIEEKR